MEEVVVVQFHMKQESHRRAKVVPHRVKEVPHRKKEGQGD